LAQAVATANNEPTSDIPRRLIRRGNGAVYNPSRIIAWNHQLLPTFNKFNQFRSNPDARTNNNKRSSDWVNQPTFFRSCLPEKYIDIITVLRRDYDLFMQSSDRIIR
jgi:hypothetical protein